jgi:uncharacterized protein YggE
VTSFAKLVDDLLAMGGTEFSGIDIGLIKEKEAADEMYEKALTNARERADKTLKTMGMKVDSVFAVSAAPFPEIHSKMFGATERVVVTGSYAPSRGELAPSQYQLGPVKVSESIYVIYLMSPGN